MTSFLGKKIHTVTSDEVQDPINDSNPIRIAFLGGAKSGKTSTISKLQLGIFRDTYYPTHQITPTLHTYSPQLPYPRSILDDQDLEHSLGYLLQDPRVVVSPVIYQSYSRIKKSNFENSGLTASDDLVICGRNQYYISYKEAHDCEDNSEYVPPHVSPILTELIDSPNFNPAQVVPFLEASLYIKLGKEILRNLANEPRQPVSTNPLLVASGASELNGNVDGYFFTFSAVPSNNPPSYNDSVSPQPESSETSKSSKNLPPMPAFPGENPFELLAIMKDVLDEAWKEYVCFKKRWELGKEHDIFSIKSALKNIWKEPSSKQVEKIRDHLRNDDSTFEISTDPADPDCLPPIWILCTQVDSPLASPKFIEYGMALAKHWKCGFIGIDNASPNVDKVLALMIREIVERRKLQKGKKRFQP